MIRVIKARPILATSVIVGVVAALVHPLFVVTNNWVTLVVSWNIGAVLYLILTMNMMCRADPNEVRARALNQDTGNYVILLFVIFSAIVCLVANVMVLGISNALQGNDKVFHILLAALTIMTSWLFTQVMFAVHYAHEYYVAEQKKQNPGLLFPGHEEPDYLDFVYFSCVLGTSGQTADISFTSRSMRRIGLIHSVMAFFFNTTLIALTINIAAGFI